VAGRLLAEIGQTRPFELAEEEAVLNIARTAEVLGQSMAEFLREYKLSPTQYNVLRILRGAGAAGVTCSQIAERMIGRDPDITRLLDRLESRGLIARQRGKEDRRVVVTRIAAEGLNLLNAIDAPLRNFLRRRLAGIGKQSLSAMIDQLERVRERFANPQKKSE
jgi:DNA-binding MarR family transcriptional regulator